MVFPGGLAIVITGVLRLAYSGAFGVAENGSLAGLSIHFAPLVVTGLFLLDGPLNHNAFAAVLYAVIVTLAILQVAPLRMDELTGA